MSNYAEIASVSSRISFEELVQNYQNAQMSSLKESIEVQQMVQEELASMINQVAPHLSQNIDIVI